MSETYSPTYPKHGTQAQRVLNALLVCGRHKAIDIGEIARWAGGCAETAASARLRELRSKHGWQITTTLHKLGKRRAYRYQIRGTDES